MKLLNFKKAKFGIAVASLVLLLSGCASTKTFKSQFEGMEEKLANEEYGVLVNQIESKKDEFYKAKDRVVYYLDVGMLQHYQGNYELSNEYLTKAENAIEELFTKSISKAATSLLLNDNALDYSGEPYEDIYLNVFKALNYLELNEFDSAFVEIRRINIKLNELQDKYQKKAEQFNSSKDNKSEFKAADNKFHNSALGRYLSMLLYRTEGKMDDARIDKDKIHEAFKLQSHIYDFKEPKFDSYLKFSEKAKLNVLGLVGKAPDKKAKTLYIHTEENLIIIGASEENPRGNQQLEELDAIYWPNVEKGYHFKFQLPYMEKRNSVIKSIRVSVNDEVVGKLQLLEDMENVAEETYEVKVPMIYLKTITRTITKGLLAERGKAKMEESIENPLLGFAARLATDIAVDATENADLRVSRFFPGKAMVGEFEIEPGTHNIKIEYLNGSGSVIHTKDFPNQEITLDGLNLIEAYYLK
jgi:hypothetical protein